MKRTKKQTAIIGALAACLFIAPLIVFAIVYLSDDRTNAFAPGSVAIQIKEGSSKGSQLVNSGYVWETDGTTGGTVEKSVEIEDTRKYPGEALRVCFVPMWYDGEGNVCNPFSFGTPVLDEDNNTLTYTDGTKSMTLTLDADWQNNHWEYRADGCFYYTGTLNSDKLTAKLLQSVQLNADAYALTADYDFRLDVLADAIQISDSAADARQWAAS